MEDLGNYSFSYSTSKGKEPYRLNLQTVRRNLPETIAKATNRSGIFYTTPAIERILQSQIDKDLTNAYNRRLTALRYQQALDAHNLRQLEMETAANQGAWGTIGTLASAGLAGVGNRRPVQTSLVA